MSNNNHRRLGRGLDSLISGGLKKPTPPAVSVDSTKIEAKKAKPSKSVSKANASKAATKKPAANSKKAPASKKSSASKPKTSPKTKQDSQQRGKLLSDLNDLLKKTQEEELQQQDSGEFNVVGDWKGEKDETSSAPKAANANRPANQEFVNLSLSEIVVSPYQRRKTFNAEALADLEASIRSEGLLQPIVVREVDGAYELIAGERRYRACSNIGMENIPARIVKAADESAAVMGLIENLQRENLNPVEEARGYGMLLSDFKMTQDAIAQATGKARATIANSLRLLLLEAEILGYLSKGQLTTGHAKVLLGLPEGSQRVLLARKVIEEGLSVRATEALIRRENANANKANSPKRVANEQEVAAIQSLQKDLTSRLNAKVTLQHSAKGGRMIVQYRSNDELDAIIRRMGL